LKASALKLQNEKASADFSTEADANYSPMFCKVGLVQPFIAIFDGVAFAKALLPTGTGVQITAADDDRCYLVYTPDMNYHPWLLSGYIALPGTICSSVDRWPNKAKPSAPVLPMRLHASFYPSVK
jgi:hypothetical protein